MEPQSTMAASAGAAARPVARPLLVDVGGLDRLRRMLTAIIVVLAALHVVTLLVRHLASFRPDAMSIFALTSEGSFGTWFSSGVLALVALAALAVGRLSGPSGRDRRGWTILSLFVLALSLDEVLALHERTAAPMRSAFDLDGFLYFAWVIPALAVVVAFAVWQWPFLRSIEPFLRRRLGLAAVVFIGAAVGLEMVESALYDSEEEFSLAFGFVAAVEETVEMVAVSFALLTVLRHLLTAGGGGYQLVPRATATEVR